MDKPLRNAVIVGIIIVALSLGYYLVVFLPQKNAQEIEMKKQTMQLEAFNKQKQLDNFKNCVSNSYLSKNSFWEKECLSLGRSSDCGLPKAKADNVNKGLEQDLLLCQRTYPQN